MTPMMPALPALRLLPALGRSRQPWKNGGGSTSEVLLYPPEATFDDFGWRISVATIEHSGAFSVFPGIERSLHLLSAGEMCLHIDGQEHQIDRHQALRSFAGEAIVSAQLPAGQAPLQVLNVMSKRGSYAHSLRLTEVNGPTELVLNGDFNVLFIQQGACHSHQRASLRAMDALYVDRPAATELTAAPATRLILIEIRVCASRP
jgi:environmental stress-induced protein Ves